jgi:hypothetical protein
MRSILTLAVAGFVAVAAIAPASAATRHKQPVRSEAAAAQRVEHPETPAAVSAQPGACFTDEGYGRYASCDQAGF